LDEYVIGQDSTKNALAVAIYNHYKRLKYTEQQNKEDCIKDKNLEVDIVEK